MTDRNKFEEMLERLINEDKAGAEELFHQIVVEKSRDIYEGLLESDLDEIEEDEEVEESEDDLDEATDEEVDESDEEVEEGFDLDEFEVEADPVDDMMGDLEMGDDEDGEDDEEGEEGDEELEDRVMDIEDALDDLKAEFEKMMAGEEGEEHDMDDEEGDDEEGEEEPEEESYAFESEDEDEDEEEMEESKSAKTAGEQMREYVEKVSAKMGDTGTNGTKSAVAGKNDMGGTAGNIAQGSADEKGGTGASAPKEDSAGNVNVPGGKAAKAGKTEPGHGAEKKGKPDQAANKTPVVGK
jgi:hypothetical protein